LPLRSQSRVSMAARRLNAVQAMLSTGRILPG
jgi:hypothetical protein